MHGDDTVLVRVRYSYIICDAAAQHVTYNIRVLNCSTGTDDDGDGMLLALRGY